MTHTAKTLKKSFVDFFTARDHTEIPSASLIPENDPSTLFISAGIQPLVPYFLGKKHPHGKRLVSVQKCVRTVDIEEVGDKYHHTFFEMLGNWSLGDYFKAEMIPWSFELLTKIFNYSPLQLHVTCFAGDSDAPRDEESAKLWLGLGIPQKRIHFLPKKDNWWGPPGVTGPCGPDTEMFIDTDYRDGFVDFATGCKTERIVELGNDVFIQYAKNAQGGFDKLTQNNIDTGYGVERNLAILNGLTDNYQTPIWRPIIAEIEKLSDKDYEDKKQLKPMRVVADHIRAAVFMIAAGLEPSNKEAGYVLRRLIRRAIRQGKYLSLNTNFTKQVAEAVLANQANLAGDYPELNANRQKILATLTAEESRFRQTLDHGLREFSKLTDQGQLNGQKAFFLYETFGFPLELIEEEAKRVGLKLTSNFTIEFTEAKQVHQESSRSASQGRFSGGLADHSEVIVKYHTATHLLHSSLRRVLGEHVSQAGSNITKDRARFDFTHHQKLTPDELSRVEATINQAIQDALPVVYETMSFADSQRRGALAFFSNRYPKQVTVYTIGTKNTVFSQEVCQGPHVQSLTELSPVELFKEETSGAGKRRIYLRFKQI